MGSIFPALWLICEAFRDLRGFLSARQGPTRLGGKSFVVEHRTPGSVWYNVQSAFPNFEKEYRPILGERYVKGFIVQLMAFEMAAMRFVYEEEEARVE